MLPQPDQLTHQTPPANGRAVSHDFTSYAQIPETRPVCCRPWFRGNILWLHIATTE